MTVLVFGQTGQVARELVKYPQVTCVGRAVADLTNPEACETIIDGSDASCVINAAAYTAVDKAEEEPDLAHRVNALAPIAMARACAAKGVPFVQISTDYVFDGSGTLPWKPDAATEPLGVYGATKRAGEDGVRDIGGPHAILRTSWVFSAHGQNFVKTMLRLGATRDRLAVVADQIGGPTAARALAEATLKIALALVQYPDRSGTYHFAGAPDVSWADFARAIFAKTGTQCTVSDILTTDYPTSAERPKNSRLDCTTTFKTFGLAQSDWRLELDDVLADLGANK